MHTHCVINVLEEACLNTSGTNLPKEGRVLPFMKVARGHLYSSLPLGRPDFFTLDATIHKSE